MKKNSVSFLFFSLSLAAYSEACPSTWISVDGNTEKEEALTYDIIESSVTCYKVKITVNGMNDQIESRGNEKFHHLYFDDLQHLTNVGAPALPVITQTIAIPANAKVKAKVEELVWKDLKVGTIYPAQESLMEGETAKEFRLDKDIYGSPFIPDLLRIGEKMDWRGIDYVSLHLCPFKYNASASQLSVLKELVLQVDFTYVLFPKDPCAPLVVDNSYGIFSNVERNDSRMNQNMLRDNGTEQYDYLIIVGSGLTSILNSDALRQFRWWKSLKGLKTKIVSTNVTGNTESSIKSYITQESAKGIRYVLFIGDADQIPLHLHQPFGNSQNGTVGDYWYGCLAGDLDAVADVAIGRFSTNSLNEFENMVRKTISYERYYNSTNHVLLVAHAEEGYQQCCDNIINSNYSEPVTFKKAYGATSDHGGTDATNDSVIQAINNGAHIINYRGHGGNDVWGRTVEVSNNVYVTMWNSAGQAFYSTEIDSMSQNSNAVFFSVACNTGNINSTCMLETFTRSPHGASAFIGATMPTKTLANDTYDYYLFDKMLNGNIYHIGELNNAAHIQNINNFENLSKDCAYSYICGGDPSMEIWTSTPVGLGEVNMKSQNDSIIINIENPGSYYISIADEEGVLAQTFISSGNRLSVPKLLGKCYLSVYRHNVSPYVAYYDSESESIQDKTFTLDSYYEHSPLVIGEFVDPQGEIGPVVIKKGTKLSIKNGEGGTTITDCFECEKGSMLIIK